jgi:hypothetical protein
MSMWTRRQLHVFCKETARPIFCGSTTRRMAIFTEVQTFAACITLGSDSSLTTVYRIQLPKWVWTYLCRLQLCLNYLKQKYCTQWNSSVSGSIRWLNSEFPEDENRDSTWNISLLSFNHLTWLLTWESFIESSCCESFRLENNIVITCPKCKHFHSWCNKKSSKTLCCQ